MFHLKCVVSKIPVTCANAFLGVTVNIIEINLKLMFCKAMS